MAADTIWNTKEIIAAVIATGVVSAVARELVSWIKAVRHVKKESTYVAMRASLALEAFASACASLRAEMIATQDHYGGVPKLLPPPPAYPADCDWRVLDATLVDELLSLLVAVDMMQNEADHARQFENNDWHLDTAAKNLGQGAWDLSKKLRKDYRLPQHKHLDKVFPTPVI